MTQIFPFDNSYARLPDRLFARVAPTAVRQPVIFARNPALAAELGLPADIFSAQDAPAWFSGNTLPAGADPIAQTYAAHQFGHWNPQLGDGRAILLGEVIDTNGQRRDIQLKGAGRTPFSRAGDGRAWLGPVMREYLASEAMHALGVPTTRALAAVTTGEPVYREDTLPGAVLTRVAASHIRVGTFQYFAARNDVDALAALSAHVIARHYPQAGGPAALLQAVVAAQARLIAHWMSLGFIHGVMNTDNCAISGETIDYGPCAFMDAYHPQTVFSSIDRRGRYAYANQPQIAVWNMAQLATSLIPLMPDQEQAITDFTEIINGFGDLYQQAWISRFAAKLGLQAAHPQVQPLAEALLTLMAENGADFTNTFHDLADGSAITHFIDKAGFTAWQEDWLATGPDMSLMEATNPQIIPRTHLIEEAITTARNGDFTLFDQLLVAFTHPYDAPADPRFAQPPTEAEKVHQTFCGT